MRVTARSAFALTLVLALAACGTQPYRDTANGKFSGALDVRWVRNDYFLFLPSPDEPFTFTRADGSSIRPGPMFTDGGSIPRFLWGVEGYSPWGYAPAYIVHDWLFEARHCGYEPDNQRSFEDSVAVMAEGLKAIMETSVEVRNYFVFDSVVAAIRSPIAKRIWDKGSCTAPAIEARPLADTGLPGELLMTIRFK